MKEEISNYDKLDKQFHFQLLILKELNEKLTTSLEKRADSLFKRKFENMDPVTKAKFLEAIKCLPLEENQEVDPNLEKFSNLLAKIVYEGIILPVHFIKFIREMGLVFLVTEFESLLRSFLEITFAKNPKILSTNQKSITFEELMRFSDLESARKKIIDKETVEIINQDIEDISEYFSKKLGIEFSDSLSWDDFKERFYRRNIIVHNSGIPNNIYVIKTGYKGELKRLEVSREYLEESIVLFSVFADGLTQELERKFKQIT